MYIISHFLNEEFLLPYWLKHHVPMFEQGIMIDYGSTDTSVDIIRELAPHWQIRKTTTKEFREPYVGQEVQQIESELVGAWKVVLNVTEFLVCSDLASFIKRFRQEFPELPGFRATGVVMIDSIEERCQSLTKAPLLFQRSHGVVEKVGNQNVVTGRYRPSRCRFVHRLPSGGYRTGRHTTAYQFSLGAIDKRYAGRYWWNDGPQGVEDWMGIHPEIFVCWFGRYCPFEAIKARVAYFDFHIPRESFLDRKIPASPEDLSLLEKELSQVQPLAYNLKDRMPIYAQAAGRSA